MEGMAQDSRPVPPSAVGASAPRSEARLQAAWARANPVSDPTASNPPAAGTNRSDAAPDRPAQEEAQEREPDFRDTFRLSLFFGGLILAMWLTIFIVFLLRL
ncbi:hypothetical protein [Hydrogenibacillus sp. N12]|uniref:hypothetical protein n=1 Tax=Hydrogenibacillus sp. N12 TaxID=2866627 RepID=UPI001C7D56F8|nr:hypothetical protein [Hydrogenibacillus sp. N12]QZA33443.1 hypothetical protein K2M58_02545 [Hydrogenibacillus sp. N12]